MPGCCDESAEKTSLLGRSCGHRSAIGDALPGARHHLPRVGFFKPKDVRDITIWIVERLPEDVGSSFGGRQLFQQQQNPKRQCLASFRSQSRVGAGIDWFRQPGPDGTHVSEAECCADRRFAPGAAADDRVVEAGVRQKADHGVIPIAVGGARVPSDQQ